MFNHHHPQSTADDFEPRVRLLTTLDSPHGTRALIARYVPTDHYPFAVLDVPAFENPWKTRNAIVVDDRLRDLNGVFRTATRYLSAIFNGMPCQHSCPTCSGGPAVQA